MSEYLGNMLPLRYTNLYEENGWKVHVCEPGLTPTKLEGTGWTSAHVQTVEDGCTELNPGIRRRKWNSCKQGRTDAVVKLVEL